MYHRKSKPKLLVQVAPPDADPRTPSPGPAPERPVPRLVDLDRRLQRAERLGRAIQRAGDHPKKKPSRSSSSKPKSKPRDESLGDIAEIFQLDARLTTLEEKQQLDKADEVEAGKIGAVLAEAHVLIKSIVLPDEVQMYRQAVAAYSKRLKVLSPETLVAPAEEAVEVDLNIQPEDRAAYRNDIRNTAMWGGLAEAEIVARHFGLRVSIFRTDANGRYQRVITIGDGAHRGRDLLHLGNHYVAVRGAIDGQLVGELDRRFETEPDGNCLFEALYIVQTGHKPPPNKRARYLELIRRHVANQLTDEAIDATLVAILTQGETGGLGPLTRGRVETRFRESRIQRYDKKSLEALAERLHKSLEDSDRFDYQEKINAFLRAKEEDPSSPATTNALEALEQSIAEAEQAVRIQKWSFSANHVELSLDWYAALKRALPSGSLEKYGVNKLAAEVVSLNRDIGAKKAEKKPGAIRQAMPGWLATLDKLEQALKETAAPEQLKFVPAEARDQVKIALFAFYSQDLRAVRANLVILYFANEAPGAKRTGGPGGRPDLHYDVYARGEVEESGQRATAIPKSIAGSKKDLALVKSMDPGQKALGANEGLTAVALRSEYPDLFGNIKRAERRDKDMGIQHDVEYFDNHGNPWDQKAPPSFAGQRESEVSNWVSSIVKQLGKQFPRDKTGGDYHNDAQMVNIGVVLDCTYLDGNDYARLWSALIQRLDAQTLAERIIEVNVPVAATDRSKNFSAPQAAEKTNMTFLDKARKEAPDGNRDGILFTVTKAGLGQNLTQDLGTYLEAIRTGGQDYYAGVYRNHGNFLPNRGSYFLKYYPPANTFPDGAKLRIVYDKPNDIFYITGSHYVPWMAPYENVLRHPFYRIE